MTHAYSMEIHDYIREKIAVAQVKKKQAEEQNDTETRQFYLGQLEALFEIRAYIAEKMDLTVQTER